MQDIIIKDVGAFCDFLKAIIAISPSQEFIITPEGCRVRAVNELSTIRAFISTDAVTSAKEITFCLNETFKLSKALTKIYEFNGKDLTDEKISFDNTFIYYNSNGYKFKFATVKRKVVERCLTDDIVTNLEYDYGFEMEQSVFKNLMNTATICSTDGTKVYFYKEDETVIADIDDKVDAYADSVSLPVSKIFDGNWSTPICTKLDIFRLFNVIGAEKVKIYATAQRALLVEGELNGLKMKLVTGIVKK